MLAKKNPQEGDITLPNPPSDSISCLSSNGSQTAPTTLLIAGSWDSTLSMYEIQYGNGAVSNIIRHQQLVHEGPVLCSDIAPDGMTTFSAGADCQVRMWNASQPTSSVQIVGKHDQPVRCMKFLSDSNVLITGSWDKTIRIWDLRQPTPAAVMQLSERVHALDAKGKAIVAATADKMLHIFELTNKVSEYKSPINYQTRSLSIFADQQGYALGSIEGRIHLEYFSENNLRLQKNVNQLQNQNKVKSFSYKCHRNDKEIHSVNVVDFHPNNTFLSAASDGCISIWDKEVRTRVSAFEAYSGRSPITAAKFSPQGSCLFYALSYDWSKGSEHYNPQMGNNLVMHIVTESDIVPQKKK